jgi:hypothetical protein
MMRARPFKRRIAAWAALLGLAVPAGGWAAPRPVAGSEIYRKTCASCHGKAGEGVKKEYQEPLVGDWPLDKLAGYIHRAMPEDKPKSLTPEQSDAVARYIYDTFYSREARLRKNPPRVELVRLTNRQYLNTVADLLKSFTGGEATLGGERGLRASSRGGTGRRGDGGRSLNERVDRAVEFDFLDTNSTVTVGLTNSLGITWSGSLIVEETGEHEFFLKTPNGARLWVNHEDKPLIDAGVASGSVDEHKAGLRLIGGRAYPIRLEWNKAQRDKLASVTLQWQPPHGTRVTIPARNLSPQRVAPTFVVATPFPADDSSVGYERGVLISKAWDEAATQAAIEVANFVESRLDQLSGSKKSDADRAAKVQRFCEKFVEAAFRRPLSAERRRLFVEAHFKGRGAPKPEDAAKRVVLLALKSPQFLYLGLSRAQADDHEVAARLSFGLWDSLPDRDLLLAAAQGALRTREQVAAQARRMLADPRARAKVQAFFHHWLQVNHADDLSKDAKLYPGFTPEIIADLRTSLNLFLEDVFWHGNADYRRLLLEDDLFVNGRLAQFYGITNSPAGDFVKVALDPKQRAGVVTHPYLLAAFSYQKTSSPIHRGVFLTRNIVGRALKPPPDAIAFKDEEFPAELTMREKVAALTRSEACQNCHAVINPLGFSLEQYDAVGRFRTRENGKPIDATADYETDDGRKLVFKGARDLAEHAAASEQAQEAFVEQLFHQVVKQPAPAYGPDTLARLRHSFAASGFNMQQLLVEIAATAAMHEVAKTPKPKKA